MSGLDDIFTRLTFEGEQGTTKPVSLIDLAKACDAMIPEESCAMDAKLKILEIMQKILNSERLLNLPEDDEVKIMRLISLLKYLRQYKSHTEYLDSILKVLEYNLFPEEN